MRSLLVIAMCLLTQTFIAQHALPYSTSFESQADRDDWEEFRTGATDFFEWEYATVAPAHASHDYPVGATSSDTTIDWLVSPEIHFHSTSKLALSAYVFTLIDLTPEDRFEIWFSNGSKNPADGDYSMIADLTNFGVNGTWTDTSGIILEDTGTGYVAFVYQATNNWFTVAVDSIEIIPDTPLSSHVRKAASVSWQIQNGELILNHTHSGDVVYVHAVNGTLVGEWKCRGFDDRMAMEQLASGLHLVTIVRNESIIASGKAISL